MRIFVFCILLLLFACYGLQQSKALSQNSLAVEEEPELSTINPWIFEERLSALETLLNATHIPIFGENNLWNLLWGLDLQFQWQNRSGRLPRGANGEIENDAWWAAMNYYLSIVPYLAAMNIGVVPPTIFLPANSYTNKFPTNVSACDPSLIEKWENYFTMVELYRENPPENATEELQKTLWKAHTSSLATAEPLFVSFLALYSQPEQNLGTNWALFVKFLAAALFPTNYYNISQLQPFLPYRVLNATDHPPHIKDMTIYQNRLLYYLDLLGTFQNDTDGELLDVWALAMETPEGIQEGQYLIANSIQDPDILIEGAYQILKDAIIAEGEKKHKEEKFRFLTHQLFLDRLV